MNCYHNRIVDVLIPAFNAEKYIRKCIKSVIDQTISNWKIIIIDDGSTDKTGLICDHLANQDDRIMVIHQANAGIVETRKRLLEYVEHDFFMFIDADDLIHSHTLERLLNVAVNTGADIVCANNIQNISHYLGIGTKNFRKIGTNEYRIHEAKDAVNAMCGYPQYHVGIYSRLYKKNLKTIDYSSIPRMFVGEDVCTSILLFEKAKLVATVEDRLYFYRAGGGARKYYASLATDIVSFYTWRKQFIEKQGIDSKYHKENLLNTLHIYRNICGGNKVNGIKDYNTLNEMIQELNHLDGQEELKDFFKQLLKSEKQYIYPERERLLVRIKQFIIKHF